MTQTLPAGWRLVPLSEVAQVVMGQSPPGSTYNATGEGLPFYQGKADFGDDHPTPRKWCSAPTRVAEAGDVLMSVRAPVGPTNIATERCAIGRGLAAIRPKNGFPSTLIRHAIQQQEAEIASWGTGTTFTAINKDDFKRIELRLPPADQVHSLAKSLDRLVALRRRARARLASVMPALKQLRRAVLAAAYSGELTADWREARGVVEDDEATVRTLGEYLADGLFVDGDWVESKDQDPNGDVRLVQLADVGDGVFRDRSRRFLTSESAARLDCTFLEAGDILIARMPEPLGRACVFPGLDMPAVTAVDVCIVRVGPAGPLRQWLEMALNAPQVRAAMQDYVRGTTRQRISRRNLGVIELRVPAKAEQEEVVLRASRLLSKAASVRAHADAAARRIDATAGATLNKAFGGEVSEYAVGLAEQSYNRAK